MPLTVSDLLPLALRRDRRAYSPLTGPRAEPLLLVDLDIPASADELAALTPWLRELPAPVIGIGDARSALATLCDCTAAALDDASGMIETIRCHPLAATVFVQLLRAAAALPLRDALVAESLAYATLQNGPEFRAWRAANPPSSAAPGEPGPAVTIERDDALLRLTLNRPANRNAMTVEMRDALCEALQLAQADASITRVEIRGHGKCFSTGGDLREFGSAPDGATAHLVRSLALPGRELAAVAARTAVFVHGACIGSGIEFPAFAAHVAAEPNAWFQLPELAFGLIPGAGGCVSVARRIGRQRTAWMVLSGERITAAQALDWGLVDEIR